MDIFAEWSVDGAVWLNVPRVDLCRKGSSTILERDIHEPAHFCCARASYVYDVGLTSRGCRVKQ